MINKTSFSILSPQETNQAQTSHKIMPYGHASSMEKGVERERNVSVEKMEGGISLHLKHYLKCKLVCMGNMTVGQGEVIFAFFRPAVF